MISGLRGLGLPAAYVSGYLRTVPRAGAARLEGADAMHAWVMVWCGSAGWWGLDPTNALIASDDHVVLAIGRDYADAAPIGGVVLGSGSATAQHGGRRDSAGGIGSDQADTHFRDRLLSRDWSTAVILHALSQPATTLYEPVQILPMGTAHAPHPLPADADVPGGRRRGGAERLRHRSRPRVAGRARRRVPRQLPGRVDRLHAHLSQRSHQGARRLHRGARHEDARLGATNMSCACATMPGTPTDATWEARTAWRCSTTDASIA